MDNNRNDINGSNRRPSGERNHTDRNSHVSQERSRASSQSGNSSKRSSDDHRELHSDRRASSAEDKRTHSGTSSVGSARRPEKSRAAKKRRRNTALISVGIFLVVLAVVIFIFWRVVDTYEPPMSPGPSGRDTSAVFTDTPKDTETAADDLGTAPVISNVGNERKKGFYTMLAVGHDAVAVNTDVIMLVSFDTENGAVSIMQIPRDTYIEANGYARKINSVYGAMRDRSLTDKDEKIASGMSGLAHVIEDGLGIPIDFWAMVDLGGFNDIVNAIGGVEIDLAYDMKYQDPDQDLYIDLKQGHHKLNGELAEHFVRFRYGYVEGDIGRVDAQKVFMSALFRQLKSSVSISNVAKLAETTIGMVNTNMKVLDCVYFGKNFLNNVDFENITFLTMPGDATREHGTYGLSYYVMRRADMLDLVNKYFNPYTTPLTETSIDPKLMFNAENNQYISKIYLSAHNESLDDDIYNANEINNGELNIPLISH